MDLFFPILILNARPAAGKTEITRYLENIPLQERIERFHIGSLKVLDDFPILWDWFEEDDLLEKEFDLPRLHSTPDRYFKKEAFWHLLISRLNLDFDKWHKESTEAGTTIIEFSRGTEHGGYQEAYEHLSDNILERASCLYVHVSFEESFRKNKRRFNPDRPYSILQHALEGEKMRRLYLEDDWFDFSASDPDYLSVRNMKIPYAVLENEDDVTTHGGSELGLRLEGVLEHLWALWEQLHTS
jgi:hypothetical protein